MRGLPLLLLSVSFAGAIVVACGSFDGEAVTVDDAGGNDSAVTNDSSPAEEAGSDAGSVADADAADGLGYPDDMVPVLVGPKTFLIDKTEVTYKAYGKFVDAVSNNGDAGFPSIPGCKWHPVSPAPMQGGCALEKADTAPITCVDWCDAVAYCQAQDKRLCGAINGGATPYADEGSPAVSQWARACANDPNSADRYPYGSTLDATACNANGNPTAGTGTRVLPVATFPKCQGGVAGLYDMVGNAAEWTDSCTGTENGANDTCITHGGSWGQVQPFCSAAPGITRGSSSANVGFRCCKDVP